MNEQDRDTLQMRRLVEADRPHPSGPDVDTLLAAGHRRLRRRRVGTGAAALAVVAAIAVPAYVVSGGTGERASDNNPGVATSPSNGQPSTSRTPGCGVLLCVDAESSPEKGELVGEPWVLSEPTAGVEEVVYAARTQGIDLATGEKGTVDVLMLGYRQDGKLHRSAWALQPGSEGVSPEGDTASLWSNGGRLGEKDSDVFFVLGYVEGAPEEITWSTPEGDQGAVDGTNSSVVPGYTAFYLTVSMLEDTGDDGPQVVERDGKEYLAIGGGDSFQPDITFHSSDGWSCSLADCGSVG